MNLPFGWTIRDAAPDDALAIAAVLKDCWPDDTADAERIARLIGGGHTTVSAWSAGACVGFADCFPTRSADGVTRWEVDLLAVAKAARGRGIGKALVAAAVQAAPKEAEVARGLVRIGNTAAERAFGAAGFRPESAPRTLYVAAPQATVSTPRDVTAIRVETFSYCGLWLESRPDADGLIAARDQASVAGLEQVGTFALDAAEVAMCRAAGYEAVGVFRWWVRTL